MDIEKIKKFFSGKYEFKKLLGRGGVAEVHLALDKMLDREVAIKILLPQHTSDPDIVKRFIREARLYAKLEHPNLINIYETGIAEGTAFIVMKYVKGENLKVYITKDKETRLSLAPRVLESLSDVLGYIHKKGIIHRDIKPANIILENEGEHIYLADFGIARSVSSQTMTQTGSIMGTPYYISPEQIKGNTVDHRSDLYALGATIYELITGKPVFSADSSIEILYKHVNSEPEQIGKTIPDAPKNLRYIVSKCLEKKPEKRFQDAKEIKDILVGTKVTSITKYLNSVESGKGGRKGKFFLILLLLISIPFVIYLLNNKSENRKASQVSISDKKITKPLNKNGEKRENQENSIKNPTTIKNSKMNNKPVFNDTVKKKVETGDNSNGKNQKKYSIKPKDQIKKTEKKDDTPLFISNEPGTIRFSSFPPSDIYWNDLKLGDTSQIFKKEFPPGKYKFTFKIEGYTSHEKEIEVKPGKEVIAHYRFKPYGYLTITAKPFARFFINGKDYGADPIFKKKFPVGVYTIKAEKPGYLSKEQKVQVIQMKKININFSLTKEEEK